MPLQRGPRKKVQDADFASQSHVVVAEDEAPLRRAYARMLAEAGYQVRDVANGMQAIDVVREGMCDVLISDIAMPEMNGMHLLRAVREHDLDLPVILVTGNPSVETAVEALEYGALRYLVKPVELGSLVEAVGTATKLRQLAALKREAAAYLGSEDKQIGDRAGLEATLERGLQGLWMAYQPLVDPERKRVAAFEALVRTREPTLPHPGALFEAAERVGWVHEVGREIRRSVASSFGACPADTHIFLNLHPRDLLDETLYLEDAPLTAFADRIVLEITERAAFEEATGVPERIKRLRRIGYRIAIDDLGAGYAGLNYFALLAPDVVKLDMELIRHIDQEPVKRKIVSSMTTLCKELGMLVVAEGVESTAERDVLVEQGCDLLQGYLFAKPGPPFPEVNW